MKWRMLTVGLVLFTAAASYGQSKAVDVYILAGQSNMQGIGQLKNLRAEEYEVPENVFLYYAGKFLPMTPVVLKKPGNTKLVVSPPEPRAT